MAKPTFLLPVVFVALSVGIVVGAYVLLAPASRTRTGAEAPAADALAQVGVQGAGLDSARRGDGEPEDDDESDAPRLPTIAPVAGETRTRPEAPPPEPPPPPVVLDADAQAAQDAYFAQRDKLAEQLARDLNGQKSALKKACWTPALAGDASSASYSVNASFDAGGKLLAMNISDKRGPNGGGGPAGVSECLRQQALALEIPPPGQHMEVQVPLVLP